MSFGTRYTANTGNDDIKLKFQFLINGAPVDASAYNRVEIYDTYLKAYNSDSPDEILAPGDITDIGDGLVEYVIQTPTVSGTYFDKIYLTPKAGYSEISFISAFYVADEDFGGGPSESPSKCQVSGYIIDESGTPIEGAVIKAYLNNTSKAGTDYLVMNEPIYAKTNEIGFFTMSLIRSTEFNPNINYTFEVKYSAIQKIYEKTIPNEAGVKWNDLT